MPINSSSISALRIARRLKKRKRYAAGGSPTNPALWDVPEEELPAGSGYSPFTAAAAHIAKRMFWDLPHEAINAAKGTSYGLRREDYTDVPPDYSPDPNSPLGGVGVKVPRGAWQPTDPLIGASLEGATNVMGGTALSSPGKAAGEFVAGAGPRDPALWHGISKVKLPKPISEMSAVHAPSASFAERFAKPSDFQGGTLVPLIGDRTRAGTDLLQVNGYKFDRPVPMQGGHGFMGQPTDPGAAWASGKPIANQLANVVRAQEGPVYGAYTAMGERSGDFSHHIADALVQMLPHTKVPKAGRAAFDADMRELFPDFPGVGSAKLQTYLDESPGAVRAQFVKLMDTAKYQGAGFPSVAEARFATTDPRLLHAETGASGLSMARLKPETFAGSHRSYDTNLAGDYVGGLPTSIPKEVMYPDIVQAIERYRDALPGYKPTIDYLMTRTPKGLPRVQPVDQKWVDTVSKHLEDRGFKLGAGATDKRAAALAAADDILANEQRLARAADQGYTIDPANKDSGHLLGSGATDKRAASLAAVDDILDAERRLAGATHEPAQNLGAAERAAAPATDPGQVGPGGGGAPGVRGLPEAQATAARWAGERKPLEGLPGALKIGEDYFVPGPIAKIHDIAEDYMRTVHPDRPYTPPTKYHPIDPEHSKAIAKAYEEMPHTPNDPATKASYDALIDETAKQYQAIKKTGLKIEPIPAGAPDPYAANPRLAAIDVAENNHLWFFPTEHGFGTLNKVSDNPMLRPTGEKIGDHELLANDMFRVVHDYFGHLKEGHGFRAAGEDNAWRTHAQMYSDLARPAMTTETRGQNSWVNYGPHGDKNRTASGADTVYADQKVGLMPEWTMRDRGSPDPIIAYHGSPYSFDRFKMDKIGAGEGNQAYGHGLYFAGHSPVSEWYRHQLASRRDPLLQKYGLDSEDGASIGIKLANAGGDAEKVIAHTQELLKPLYEDVKNGDHSAATRNMIKRAEGEIAYLQDAERNPGHMYQVAIDAPPERFLDYDKPFTEQSPYVQERLTPMLEERRRLMEASKEERLAKHKERLANPRIGKSERARLEKTIQALMNPEDYKAFTGERLYGMAAGPQPNRSVAAPIAAEKLKELGVAGIRYLDQMSRGLGFGTQNFVSFDDNMVKILRKYGIVGIPAAGVLGVDGEERRAEGGAVNAAMDVARRIRRAKGGKVHIGPIMGDTDGRADEVPMEVPDGAYVLTADHVSSMGEGNTLAGFKKLNAMFPKSAVARTAKRTPVKRAAGGAVPIYAADGEYVICPEDIIARWGDLDEGHRILDAWQTASRKEHVNTLRNLAPPAQD